LQHSPKHFWESLRQEW